ncbi:MAG: 2-succinyl-5-enolpyruvyl-6-hydroxy-3-cyclohexene-1-carboxylic-acid synthase [Solirubrobacterales bacterium]
MDPTNANTALASAFVEELARCGVRRAVLSPGSRSTPLAVALHREGAIELSVIVDERSAAFFALGAAQATSAPVAILCTSGTAAANLHPAVCEADESRLPLIVLTADRPPELRGTGAGQTIDQVKLYGSAVRWFCEVGTHDADDEGLLHHRSVACRAVAAATAPARPGPVHLNLAWREPLAPVPVEGAVTAIDPLALEGRGERPLTAAAAAPPAPTPFMLDEIARHLGSAERPLIVAGRQSDSGLREPLAALAATCGAPVLAEPTSQMRLGPHDRSMVLGAYDSVLRAAAAPGDPDLVLRVGEMPTSKPLRQWLASCGADQIAVDPTGAWNEPTGRAAAIVRAEPSALAAGLAERLGDGAHPGGAGTGPGRQAREGRAVWLEGWLAADASAHAALGAALAASGGGEPTEPALQLALGAAYRDGDLVYTASSMPIRDQETFLPGGEADVLFLANRGANGIDGLISSGIGAAHASGRPTVIVTGDLGLLHDIGGLAALRGVSAPVRIVVVNNDGGGIFDFLPQADALPPDEFETLLGTPRGVDVGRAASLFGLDHRVVSDLADLRSALEAGTGLIEVPVDRAANVAVHRRLAEAVRASLSR